MVYFRVAVPALLVVLALSGCASSSKSQSLSVEERTQLDHATGRRLAEDFEAQLAMRKDIEVSVFLRRTAEALSEATPELRGTPVGVFISTDRDRKWRNYALPGNRIYVSTDFLKAVQYENELAAALAIELAHILRRHAMNRLELDSDLSLQLSPILASPGKPVFFGPAGIFTFSEEDWFASAETAVGILYRSGFDPRGLVGLWQKYLQNDAVAPLAKPVLNKLLERTRYAIASYAPLRNPIVQSNEFLAIRKRLQKL